MKNRSLNQAFSLVELVIVLLVVGIIGLLVVVGYNRWQSGQIAKTSDTSSTKQLSANASDVTVSLPQVNTISDLDSAASSIDQINLNDTSSDTAQLDSQAANF